jgi:hypothetical protein
MGGDHCDPDSIPRLSVVCDFSSLLILSLASRVFLWVLQFSSLHKKTTFLNCNSRGPDLKQASGFICYILGVNNKAFFFPNFDNPYRHLLVISSCFLRKFIINTSHVFLNVFRKLYTRY